jgi:hypothetical protein
MQLGLAPLSWFPSGIRSTSFVSRSRMFAHSVVDERWGFEFRYFCAAGIRHVDLWLGIKVYSRT